jgi:hypothetical protein
MAMTDQQSQHRAAFIKEQPALWLFLLYVTCFFGAMVCADVLQLLGGSTGTLFQRYVLPLVIALPMWFGMRGWARRHPAPTGAGL